MPLLKKRPTLQLNCQDDAVIKIRDHIFIGHSRCAENESTLRANNITHVINLAKRDTEYPFRVQTLRVVISDNKDMDILPILPITNAYIECASRQGNVLIHCEKGISRSPAVIAAYLIKKDHMSFEDAYRLLRSKRRCVQINEGFTHQLCCYEKANGDLFRAESIFNKELYSEDDSSNKNEVMSDSSEGLCTPTRPCSFSNPEVYFCPTPKRTIPISITPPFSFPLSCSSCNKLILQRYNLIVNGWKFDEDVNLLSRICTILDTPATNDTQDSNEDRNDDSLYSCLVEVLSENTSFCSSHQHLLKEAIAAFRSNCHDWTLFLEEQKEIISDSVSRGDSPYACPCSASHDNHL
ncbi:hypothetical protein WA577_006828 [Blastocystis sp. JDR]